MPFVDLAAQYQTVSEEINQSIARVLKSGWFILGKELISFEQEFARFCNVKYAVGVGSGTEALHLSLCALGITHGDEVITVANTAVPTVSAISFAGARPSFVDIDRLTYTMDPQRLGDYLKKQKPSSKIKAIIPVHLYGYPADMDAILSIAQKH